MIRHYAALMGAVLAAASSLGAGGGREALDLDALSDPGRFAGFTLPPPQSFAAASGPGYGWDMARIAQARRRGRKLQRKLRGQR